MINLIPPHAHTVIRREYYARVAAVWLLLVSAACLIVGVLLIPVYVLVQLEQNASAAESAGAAEKIATFDADSAQLVLANQLATTITTAPSTTQYSPYIRTIESLAGAVVDVYAYRLTTGKTGTQITIEGQADTRVGLASFRDQLESVPQFVAADLPISALIKDRDISFTMTITVATTTSL